MIEHEDFMNLDKLWTNEPKSELGLCKWFADRWYQVLLMWMQNFSLFDYYFQA